MQRLEEFGCPTLRLSILPPNVAVLSSRQSSCQQPSGSQIRATRQCVRPTRRSSNSTVSNSIKEPWTPGVPSSVAHARVVVDRLPAVELRIEGEFTGHLTPWVCVAAPMERIGSKKGYGSDTVKRILSGFLVMMLAAATIGYAKSKHGTVSIALSIASSSVKAGSKIWIDVVTTNLSTQPIEPGFYPGPQEGWSYSTRIQVLDSHDKAVALKPLDQSGCKDIPNCRIVERRSGSFVRFTVEPKKNYKSGFVISDVYDLTEPGTYAVQAFRLDKGTGQTDQSNVMTFTVLP